MVEKQITKNFLQNLFCITRELIFALLQDWYEMELLPFIFQDCSHSSVTSEMFTHSK